jgi:NADH dehydrogenase (ubiquinone) 1 alpha subcomplex subunit 5
MRPALRLLASVTKGSQLYAEAGLPTGLTGLLTHYSPRSTLLYLYSSTLDKLQSFPEHSVYRQSTEALTRHRMSIVESVKPAGLAEWQQRVEKLVDEHPEAFKRVPVISEPGGKENHNIIYHAPPPSSAHKTEDDAVNAAYKARPQQEGPQEQQNVADRGALLEQDLHGEEVSKLRVEAEPALTMDQVSEVEQKIGSGLIEEVIAVAEGEKALVERMAEDKV